MDFEMSEKMSTMLAMIREFMDREVIPLEGEMLHGDPATLEAGVKAAQAKVKQMGLWAPNHPVEFGGLGLSMVDHGLFARGRRAAARSGMTCSAPRRPTPATSRSSTSTPREEQRERFLRPLVAGEIRSCFSMTEPEHAGSNPVLLAPPPSPTATTTSSTARSGSRRRPTAPHFAIVMAVTNPDAPPHQRASMIIVPTDTPGLQPACATSA